MQTFFRVHGMGKDNSTLRRLQQQYSDQLLTLLTILLLIMLFVVAPIQATGILIADAFGVIVGLAMVAGVLVISASPTATAIMFVGFSLNVVVVVARLIRPLAYDLYLVAAAWLIVVLTLGFVVARTVFGPGAMSFHRIIGAVLLYLLMALAFVSLFMGRTGKVRRISPKPSTLPGRTSPMRKSCLRRSCPTRKRQLMCARALWPN